MSKPSLEERLLDLLYGDLDPETAAAVEAEVKTDPVLRERLEAWRQVRRAMADLPEPQPDPQVRYAILRAARQAVEQPEKKGFFAWFTSLSMSPAFAALGLAVLGGGLWFALSQGYRDSEAPPESRLEKAAVGAPRPVASESAPTATVTLVPASAEAPGLRAGFETGEGADKKADGKAEEKANDKAEEKAKDLPLQVAEEAPIAEPETKKSEDAGRMARSALAEPTAERPLDGRFDDQPTDLAKARRAPAAEAAAAEGRQAGKALLDLATGQGRGTAAGDTAGGFGGGGLAAEDAFAGVPPPPDEGQTAGIKDKRAKAAPSPFPAEESEAPDPRPAPQRAAGPQVAADAPPPEPLAERPAPPIGGAVVRADADAEDTDEAAKKGAFDPAKEADLEAAQAEESDGIKTVDRARNEAPPAPTAKAPAKAVQALDDAPAKAPAEAQTLIAGDTEEATDEAVAAGEAVPAVDAVPAVEGLARTPAREQPPGTPGELLEARNARRRGDHDAAVEAYQRYFAGYRSDDQVASAWLEAAQSYEALGNLASALQLYRLAARSQDPQVARTARERISAIESLRKDAARAPAEAAPAEAADTAPAEPAPAEQKP